MVLASGDVFPATYRAVTLNGVRGAAPVFGSAPAPLQADADWVEVDERGVALDLGADLRYSCGEGSAGGEMTNAAEWADTVMARSLNGTETNPLLADLLKSAPPETLNAAVRLLTDLARTKPKPVGVRAEHLLAHLPTRGT